MALCRFEAKIISRSGGRSAVGAASYRTGKCATSAAAYRAGAELRDERTGVVYDYTRKRGVMGAEIMLPAGAPDWMRDRGQLWNAVEKAEKRSDAQLARDYILTLPHELNAEQRRQLTQEFVQRQFVDKGYVADIAWHAPHGKGDERNHHAHVMVVMRRVDENGFARTKDRPPDGKHPAEHWKNELRLQREAWANTGADALKAAGFELEAERFRAGYLTLDKQREAAIVRGDLTWAEILDREAEPKQGPLATKIEQEGRESHAGNDRRAVQDRNAERAQLKLEHAKVTAKIIDLEQERAKRQEQKKMEPEPVDPDAPDADDKAKQRAEEQAEAFRKVAAAEKIQEQELSARRMREQMQQDAEQAERNKKHREELDAERHAAGDIADPRSRWAQALGSKYNVADPYGSLAQAAMAEHGAFHRQQQELRTQAAAQKDPDKARLIDLRRQVEYHEYMAITDHRLADISRGTTRSNGPTAQFHDARAGKQQEAADQLREELKELQKVIRAKERGEFFEPLYAAARGRQIDMPKQSDFADTSGRAANRGHAGQAGARVQGNPSHNRTASENADVERLRREAEGRDSLRPNEAPETRPMNPEARKIAAREEQDKASGLSRQQSTEQTHPRPEARPRGGKGRGR